MKKISRRQFLKLFGLGVMGMFLVNILSRFGMAQSGKKKSNGRTKKVIKTDHDLVAVKGDDPAAITRKAIEALGGMGRFVNPGAVVVVKPNMS